MVELVLERGLPTHLIVSPPFPPPPLLPGTRTFLWLPPAMDDDDDWDADPLADAIKACELKSSTAEDTGLYPFRLFTGTWNVNAKKPREDLKSWLFGQSKAGPTADIYVVGFQEIVDLSTKVCCKTKRRDVRRAREPIEQGARRRE